jgi:PadR family transcriptional regulator PadR
MVISKDLVAASATPLILSILSEGESYGYAIIGRVRELSDGRMQWTDGMLYPVLHRLEAQKLVKSRWVVSETGRKRKYYRLTRKGSRVLGDSQSQWALVYSTLKKLWKAEPCLT